MSWDPGTSKLSISLYIHKPSRGAGYAGIDSIDGIAYVESMAQLSIRNLPDSVHAQLRLKAARNGRSMEAEARAILTEACRSTTAGVTTEDLQGLVDGLYGDDKPESAADELISDRRAAAKREQ